MNGTSTGMNRLIVGGLSLVLTGSASAQGTLAQQMEAVTRIGTEQIALRADVGVDLIEEAASENVSLLGVVEALGSDVRALRLAEGQAALNVRLAAEQANDQLRGVAVNTLGTLRRFGGTPTQINGVMAMWTEEAARLEATLTRALVEVQETTPVLAISASSGSTPGTIEQMMDEATLIFADLAVGMDADLRTLSDTRTRVLRVESMRSHRPSVMRTLWREAQGAVTTSARSMRTTLRERYRAIKQSFKEAGATRDERAQLAALYRDTQRRLRESLDDAKADLRAAR